MSCVAIGGIFMDTPATICDGPNTDLSRTDELAGGAVNIHIFTEPLYAHGRVGNAR